MIPEAAASAAVASTTEEEEEEETPHNPCTSSSDRHYLLALWEPSKNPFIAKLEPNLEEVARSAEEDADEALCLRMEEDGSITVHTSKHSVPKSLLTMGIKLAIVWPLGLAGALGIAKAGIEIEAATRDRLREGLTDNELQILIHKMKPGWTALVAVYKEWMIPAAVSACVRLGAVAVWDGKGGVIEKMIEETDLENDELAREEDKVQVMHSLGGDGATSDSRNNNNNNKTVQLGTSLNKPEDKAKVCCSGYLAGLAKDLCCCCTCVVTQVANFFL
ncbi:MAG: hypothetical protein SGILL_008830 [Bacillariaceae sp.]